MKNNNNNSSSTDGVVLTFCERERRIGQMIMKKEKKKMVNIRRPIVEL
jgi:hypothetical protein